MRRAAALLAALAIVAPGAAAANPMDAFGFGARGPAMGNAQTAASTDGGAHYYNPGILALFREIHIEVGYQRATPSLSINGLDNDVDDSRGMALGVVVPGKLGKIEVAFGAASYLPDKQLTRTRTLAGDQPRFSLYDNRPQRLLLAANVGVRIGDKLSAGGGVGYMSATTGGVQLQGRIGFPDHLDSELALAVDVDLKTVRYPEAGVLYRALPWLDLGFAYRGGFVLKVDLAFRIDGDIGPSGQVPVIEDAYVDLLSSFQDLFQPAQFAGGLSARISQDFSLAFDVVLHRWSQYKNPAARIEIDLDLKDFNDQVNLPPQPDLPDTNFHDILVPHLGIEWTAARARHTDWMLRAGYTYEPTPAPMQSVSTNFIDSDKHTASLGLGVAVREVTKVLPLPFDVDVYSAYTWLPEREHRKISPVDRIGDYRAGGSVLQMGVNTRWRF